MNLFNQVITGLGRFFGRKPAPAPIPPTAPAAPVKRPRRLNRSARARMLVELGEVNAIPSRRTRAGEIPTGYRIKGGWRVRYVY